FEWTEVERILESLDADVFGISSFTANRRGTLSVARAIKRMHPRAHVSVGGPHATGLPLELLERCDAIDSVCVGEGETTFAELLERLERGEPLGGIPGLAVRSPLGIRYIGGRDRIGHLDELVDYHEHWPH